jgi:hypothetical protein
VFSWSVVVCRIGVQVSAKGMLPYEPVGGLSNKCCVGVQECAKQVLTDLTVQMQQNFPQHVNKGYL